jgi:YVTN family beta-propeller protein
MGRRSALISTALVAVSLVFAAAKWTGRSVIHPGPMSDGGVRLHNGWTIHPVGYQSPLGDMPTLLTLSPDGRYVVAGTTGWHTHTLSVFEIGDGPVAANGGQDVHVRTEAVSSITVPNAWRGLSFGKKSHRGVLYVSGGPSHVIWRFRFDSRTGQLSPLTPISVPPDSSVEPSSAPSGQQRPLDPPATSQHKGSQAFPGGLAILPDGNLLVVDEAGDRGPLKEDQLYKLDPDTGALLGQASLSKDAGPIVVTPDGEKTYVAEHGTGRLLVFRSSDLKQVADIQVGSQPNALLADEKGRVFCANSGSDLISIIDTSSDTIVQAVRTAFAPLAPVGSVPNAMCLSPDLKTLYVSNGGNNDVAVIDLGDHASRVRGFIPTGWYPVSVAVSPHNEWLFIGVGKGYRAFANDQVTPGGIAYRVSQLPGQAYGPNHDRSLTHDYIMSGLRGGLTRLAVPKATDLARDTKSVIASSPYRDQLLLQARGKVANSVLPDRLGAASPFEHVLYIIKENRTYDQVFGDIKQGEGDPNLVLYGRNVTPNHHAIAEQFVLLDNTYCDGEVSQDGWEWSTAANDSDWDIKATTYSYSGRGDPPGTRETIRPSNGYLWEWAAKRGLTYYSYGAKTFAGLFSPTWKGNFSEEWNETRRTNVPDHLKADLFIRDLQKAERTGKWPNLVVMSLTDDHTTGTRPGSRTPYASVGSNDLAIGKIVDAVSHSRFWAKTAIFIIEDDAQNGPDHIDSHRTVALVASPYTKRGSVDHTMYTSSSLVRSIELCLDLAPTSQYDAAATPMFACFTGKKDLTPYRVLPARVDLQAINPKTAPMAAESSRLDFSDVDLADWNALNHILWASARPHQRYPGSFTTYTGR